MIFFVQQDLLFFFRRHPQKLKIILGKEVKQQARGSREEFHLNTSKHPHWNTSLLLWKGFIPPKFGLVTQSKGNLGPFPRA